MLSSYYLCFTSARSAFAWYAAFCCNELACDIRASDWGYFPAVCVLFPGDTALLYSVSDTSGISIVLRGSISIWLFTASLIREVTTSISS